MKCSDSWWMDTHICFLCLISDSSGGISDDSIIHSWTSKNPFNRDMPNVDATDGIQNFCVQIQNLLNISIRMMYGSSCSMREVKFLKYDQNTNMVWMVCHKWDFKFWWPDPESPEKSGTLIGEGQIFPKCGRNTNPAMAGATDQIWKFWLDIQNLLKMPIRMTYRSP